MGEQNWLRKATIQVKSTIKAVIDFNKREKIRAKIGQITLLILMITWIVECGREILKPREISIIINPVLASEMKTDAVVTEREVNTEVGQDEHVAQIGNSVQPTSIEDRIRQIARNRGFKEENQLVNLARCESSLNPVCLSYNDKCINSANGSFDRGFLQISRKWHPEIDDECAFDIDCSTNWVINRIEKGYLYEWACSGSYLS